MIERFRIIGPPGMLLAATAATCSAEARPECITDWSDAIAIVRREGLAPIERVSQIVRDRATGEIVGSTLCRSQDRYVYRLTIRGGGGTLRILVVDARKPFDP